MWHVAPDAVGLRAHHQQRLGVRLQADQAVHHVHAGALEGLGPVDVGFLVEAGLQLHQGRHLHPPLGRPDEAPHDGAVAGGPVQRHLDGEHPRVVGGLPHERLDRGRERLVGVVAEHVALADHREDAALVVGRRGQPGLGDRRPGIVLEVGTVDGVDEEQTLEVERRPVERHVVTLEVELAQQQLDHVLGHALLGLEAHGPAEPAAAQLHLHRGEQVVGLALGHREVGVAGDPEGEVLHDLHAREQDPELRGDHLLERDEAVTVGQRQEAGQQRRHLDPGEAVLAGLGVEHGHAEVQREVRDVGERVPGVERQRGQHREDALLEDLLQVLAVVLVELVPREQLDTDVPQRRAPAAPGAPAPARGRAPRHGR